MTLRSRFWKRFRTFATTAPILFAVSACVTSGSGSASAETIPLELPPQQAPTYADLVDLALSAELVGTTVVDDQIVVPIERAPSLLPGRTRFYVESTIQRLLKSPAPLGESLNFLVDISPNQAGELPRMKRQAFVFFASRVPGQPGSAQLLSSDSLIPAGPMIEARLETVLNQLAAGDAVPAIVGIKDVISVAGNLAGESETQMFVQTANGAPVSLSVIRRPGMAPEWGVSLGEIVDQAAQPPAPETIAWYRFACELPAQLPADSYLQADRTSRQRAQEDYAFILRELGPCERRFSA